MKLGMDLVIDNAIGTKGFFLGAVFGQKLTSLREGATRVQDNGKCLMVPWIVRYRTTNCG